jgi:hypothetical protein
MTTISPFLTNNVAPSCGKVTYIMHDEDLHDPDFLSYLANYKGPKGNLSVSLGSPDFRPFEYDLSS